jgi:autotransporter-associated beta strand protein
MTSKKIRATSVICALAWILSHTIGVGANGTWTNLGGGGWAGSWNWSGAAIASGTGAVGNFHTLELTRNTVVTLDAARTLGAMNFGDVSPSHEWVLRKGLGGALTLDVLSGVPEVSVVSGTARIGVQILGSDGLTKKGAGTLILEGNNQWTGPTLVSAGTLRLGPAPQVPANVKIMPLGDSITFGGSGTNAGYRGPLHNLLVQTVPDYRFIGASATNPANQLPSLQRNHEARSSYRILDVYLNLDGLDNTRYLLHGGTDRDPHGGHWLTGTSTRPAAFPDVITLILGTNDLEFQQGVVTRYRNLLTKITTLRPDARLLAAKITPTTLLRDGNNFPVIVQNYNQIVTKVVNEFIADGKNVHLVDLHTRFPTNGLSADQVHPADIGFNWMATQWYEGILQAYTPKKGTSHGIPATSPMTVDAGARLELAGSEAAFASLTNSGIVDLGAGGILSVPEIHVTPTGNLLGGGTVEGTVILHGSTLGSAGQEIIFDGAVTNHGSMTSAAGCKLTFSSTLTNNSVMEFRNGSTLAIGGVLVNNGTLRLTAGALLEIQGTLFNNGVLDIITGPEIPDEKLSNTGVVLDSESVRMESVEVVGDFIRLTMQAQPGHFYQLQHCPDLGKDPWTDVGDQRNVSSPQILSFEAPRNAARPATFYRVRVSP